RGQGIGKNIIPAVDQVTARSAVGRGVCAAAGGRRAAEQVRCADKQVRGAVIFEQQAGPTICRGARGIKAIVVVPIEFECQFDLLQIVDAFDAPGFSAATNALMIPAASLIRSLLGSTASLSSNPSR